jgi:hypothetical protein
MIITVLSWSLLGLASSLPEHVDQAPAHEVADRFFAALGSSEPSSAMNEFSDGFKAEVRLWPAALSSMHKQFGPVTSKVLSGSALAANEREPCFVLDYQLSGPGSTAQRSCWYAAFQSHRIGRSSGTR